MKFSFLPSLSSIYNQTKIQWVIQSSYKSCSKGSKSLSTSSVVLEIYWKHQKIVSIWYFSLKQLVIGDFLQTLFIFFHCCFHCDALLSSKQLVLIHLPLFIISKCVSKGACLRVLVGVFHTEVIFPPTFLSLPL